MYDGSPAADSPTQGWPAPPFAYAPTPYRRPGSALAIASLVVSLVALVGVVLIGAWLFLSGAPLPGDSRSTLTGKLPAMTAGAALAGKDLSAAVSARIQDDGGDVARMDCPDTPKVDQGVVTVCHGSISGETWAVVVYFEDTRGHFTLDP
ncbi:MAG TPA: DUF4333 domain-containing protein, partial [Candidatus Eisenbacteria bacterium]|nr:DUF4333 domain-containing protein [Candidatus Eisenbacteria bacterium]